MEEGRTATVSTQTPPIPSESFPEFIVGGRYHITKRIGGGSYGEIYRARSITNGEEIAVKLESASVSYPLLPQEKNIYKALQGHPGIAKYIWFGRASDVSSYLPGLHRNQCKDFFVLAIELLGPSLEDFFNICSRRFTLKTVLMLADQMITLLQYIHSRSLLHRDLKPENFLMGTGRKNINLYLIDFGLAKRYRDYRTQEHIIYRGDKSMTGTARFVSINCHNGAESSRRDDMESIGYILMYFNRGSLPWQGVKTETKKQKYEKISEIKMTTSIETLCKGFPPEFGVYLNYCRGLRFEQEPDYVFLRHQFRTLYRALNGTDTPYDYKFDWMILKEKKDKAAAETVTLGSNAPGRKDGETQTIKSELPRLIPFALKFPAIK